MERTNRNDLSHKSSGKSHSVSPIRVCDFLSLCRSSGVCREPFCFYHCHAWAGTGHGGGARWLLEETQSSFSQYAVNPPTYSYLGGNRVPCEMSLDGDVTNKGCCNSNQLYQSEGLNFTLSYLTKPVSGSPCATNCWKLWKYLGKAHIPMLSKLLIRHNLSPCLRLRYMGWSFETKCCRCFMLVVIGMSFWKVVK